MKKILKVLIMITFVAFLLPACSPGVDVLEFEIVRGFEGAINYIEAARNDPDVNLDDLYREHVVDAYWETCVEGGEYTSLARSMFSNAITDVDGLVHVVDLLVQSGVEKLIEDALEKSATQLTGPPTTVCIFALDPDQSFVRTYMSGVSAFTAGAGKIVMFIYPEGDWENVARYTLAHEYHHSVYTERHFNDHGVFDLSAYLVFEGRADSFAHVVYPEIEGPWVNYLTTEQEMAQWEEIQKHLDTKSYRTQARFMFGGGPTPQWTGYTIGYHIVQAYIESHPGVSVDEWTALDPRTLLEDSGYEGQP